MGFVVIRASVASRMIREFFNTLPLTFINEEHHHEPHKKHPDVTLEP